MYTFPRGPVYPSRRYCVECGVSWGAWSDSRCWICGEVSTEGAEPIPVNSQYSMSGHSRLKWSEEEIEDLSLMSTP